MSFKPKNLTYESNEPAFLRRLKDKIGGDGGIVRERSTLISKRLQKSVEDDDPTYVLEENNDTISKAEYETLLQNRSGTVPHELSNTELNGSMSDNEAISSEDRKSPSRLALQTAGMGQGKKRKAAKIIRENPDEDITTNLQGAPDQELHPCSKSNPKKKKKKKQIKLSFDQD